MTIRGSYSSIVDTSSDLSFSIVMEPHPRFSTIVLVPAMMLTRRTRDRDAASGCGCNGFAISCRCKLHAGGAGTLDCVDDFDDFDDFGRISDCFAKTAFFGFVAARSDGCVRSTFLSTVMTRSTRFACAVVGHISASAMPSTVVSANEVCGATQ